jgi:hypothetical protein
MASFDVENLFTNVPVRETIDICLQQIFIHPTSTILGLSKQFFKTLLELAVLNSYFLFDGKYFQQTDGLGMGLPLGPTFANIFMCFYESIWLQDCPSTFKPVFYRRYVDDTFLLFTDRTHAPLFLDYLNSKHADIKFTMDLEQDKKLSFLDCMIKRENNCFQSSVFRKRTFTGLGMSFYSFCPYKFKFNSVRTLLSRAFKVCSNYVSLHDEFQFLKNFFKSNGYASCFIERQISSFLDKIYNPQLIEFGPQMRKVFLVLPYFGPQSENLRIELGKLLTEYFTGVSFNVILVNNFKIGSFFNYKDKLPTSCRSSLVYSYRCAQCASQYVGMTARTLRTRVSEHAGRSFRTGNLLAHPPHSSVREHAEQCSSRVTMDDFSILSSTNFNTDLRILESLYIYKLKPSLNQNCSSFPLVLVN